jgi:hypothetical protein
MLPAGDSRMEWTLRLVGTGIDGAASMLSNTTFRLLSDSQIRDKDIDTVKRFVRYKIGGYGVSMNDIPTGQTLYRGVFCADRPITVDRISYPPVERVTKLGRLNRPGTPKFYCSVAPASVFYELRAQKRDLIALSRWEVAEPLWMHHVGCHQDAPRRMGLASVHRRHPRRRRIQIQAV